VPILPDDTAREVFDKVTVAAEMTLDRVLPALVAGNAPRTPQDMSRGSYFGGRRPDDGVIDWSRDATTIHNLVRAVAPPYPGAFTVVGGVPARILRTRVADAAAPRAAQPVLESDRMRAIARCGGGGALDVLTLELDGAIVAPSALAERFGAVPIHLGAALCADHSREDS
jgi:methionyl-tRNA formyltransferase